jgi:hypothetical protein
MLKRINTKFGYNSEYKYGKYLIIGKWEMGKPIGDFIIKCGTKKYEYNKIKNNKEYIIEYNTIYKGPFIGNKETKEGILISDSYNYKGGIYRGYKKFMPNGKGISNYYNNIFITTIYNKGNIVNDFKIEKSNGDIFMGYVVNKNIDRFSFTSINGEIIKCEGKINKDFSYSGKIIRSDGDIFEGSFILSIKNCDDINAILSDITFKYLSGILIKYNGTIISAEKWDNYNTYGIMSINYPNGNIFTGTRNCYSKKGILKTNDGIIFNGIWDNHCLYNGSEFTGIVKYPNGDIYQGKLINNIKEGHGIFTTKNIIYECNWNNDIKHGEGFITENGIKYKMIWNNDIIITNKEVKSNIIFDLIFFCLNTNFIRSILFLIIYVIYVLKMPFIVHYIVCICSGIFMLKQL